MSSEQLSEERKAEIIEKLRRIHALAEHPSASEGEAANAAQKLKELCQKYNIELAEIELAAGIKPKDFISWDMGHFPVNSGEIWRAILISSVSISNGAFSVTSQNPHLMWFTMWAPPSLKEHIEWLYDALVNIVTSVPHPSSEVRFLEELSKVAEETGVMSDLARAAKESVDLRYVGFRVGIALSIFNSLKHGDDAPTESTALVSLSSAAKSAARDELGDSFPSEKTDAELRSGIDHLSSLLSRGDVNAGLATPVTVPHRAIHS